jgi:hypothetical protein
MNGFLKATTLLAPSKEKQYNQFALQLHLSEKTITMTALLWCLP